ncbi:PREDICTED: protein NRT1/ PTR FAMILY 1.2 [Nelumbo nucifera]|uniref:Protein NRT1/ PTR FAMILY 1.2-like n=2 Tax=Nelumbo nucifera TaxID=4432 RepID=A0A822Y5I3_NELNU|nr:PREDICTED: protein NRT1/ PTR FAMILY 1.2 [Nelumbo nucifera]DAD26871.1 TPA_asm: hypothetical protein HUJ06_028339 [Nelumbo nucifera]
MEGSSDKKITQPLSRPKGGFRTMPFIIANEAFERVASHGLMPNMILYLMKEYNMSTATGTSILFYWSALTNFMPIIGAFLSDSCLGRFALIGLGSISSLLGMILLWLTTMVPQAKPLSCNAPSERCQSPTPAQLVLLFSSFCLMSVGAGGIRACSMAFGADQLDQRDKPANKRVLESFFNWYYALTTFSVLVAITLIVYIQDHMGWKVGFGIPAILMLLSTLLFFLASSFYVKMNANKSLLTGFIQVLVVAFKNRRLMFPPNNSNRQYHHRRGSSLVEPTDKLRFLNKACIIRNEEDLTPEGTASKPWSLCTVEQVEELKAIIKVVPLWSTGIMIAINSNQSTFPVLQAKSMDRHITPNFEIPAGSFAMFSVGTLTIWVIVYDRVVLPLLKKLTGKPHRLSVKQRMGIGLVLSCVAMAVSAVVEKVRRRAAIRQGLSDQPQAIVDMSAMWLVAQHCLTGLAEAFNAIGQMEFYYSQLPKSMSSIATALFGLGMAIANLLASVIVKAVDEVTKRGGKESWVSSNLNKGHYDYYYWLLAVMGSVNFLYFLVCSWAYGSSEEPVMRDSNEGAEMRVRNLSRSRELRVIASP